MNFAITYPQLVREALTNGWTESDIARLRATYDVSEALCDGFYRGQGEPMISHLVRTAAICLADGQPPIVVRGALTHALYVLFDFTTSVRRIPTQRTRRWLRARLGDELEELAWTYNLFHYGPPIRRYIEMFETFEPLLRSIVRIRVANELEEHLDLAWAFRGVKRDPQHDEDTIALARVAGMERVADWLTDAFETGDRTVVPEAAVRHRVCAYELPSRRPWTMTLPERLFRPVRRTVVRFADHRDPSFSSIEPRFTRWPLRKFVDRF